MQGEAPAGLVPELLARAPIFIVGPSRSGTSMIETSSPSPGRVDRRRDALLRRSSRPDARSRACAPVAGAEKTCEDYFLALADRPYGRGGDPERAVSSRETSCGVQLAESGRVPTRTSSRTPRSWRESKASLVGARNPATRVPDRRHPRRVGGRESDLHGARSPRRRLVLSVVEARRESAAGSAGQGRGVDRGRRSCREVVQRLRHQHVWRAATRASLRARERHGPERVRIQRYETSFATPNLSCGNSPSGSGWSTTSRFSMSRSRTARSSFRATGGSRRSRSPVEYQAAPERDQRAPVVLRVAHARGRVHAGRDVRVGSVGGRDLGDGTVALGRALLVNRHRLGNPVDYVVRRTRLAAGRG